VKEMTAARKQLQAEIRQLAIEREQSLAERPKDMTREAWLIEHWPVDLPEGPTLGDAIIDILRRRHAQDTAQSAALPEPEK
jgi:hypothetical protein